MISPIREWLYRGGLLVPQKLPAWVVSVGNLSVGGTGKTPFALFLCEWALSRGISTALLTRGYRRKHKRLEIVGPGESLPDSSRLGDEPWMIKQRLPGISLLVHSDRARMAKRHWAKLGSPRLVILDDGFQHWRAWRDLDVVMLDANESLSQSPLPFGRLREKAGALSRADLVVITRARSLPPSMLAELEAEVKSYAGGRAARPWRSEKKEPAKIIAVDYAFDHFFDLTTGEKCSAPGEKTFVLASGVAKPDGVRALVRSLNLTVKEEIYFPDHHHLSAGELGKLKAGLKAQAGSALLVTEKDWARWRKEIAGVRGYGIRIRLDFLGKGEKTLAGVLAKIEEEACSTSR
jgi:tetraacyldisaccharide 4'-kinase